MNSSRARFKLKFRDCLRNEDSIKADAIALKLRNKEQGEFWRKVNAPNNKKAPLANNVNGCTGSSEIAEMWRKHCMGLFNEYVLPVMVYVSDTWALKKAHMELLSVAQCKMERIMFGITLRDHKRNTWIQHQTGVNYIIDIIKTGIHGWAGHIAPGSCVAKNSQRPASAETVQGGVPPYGVKETLVVNGKNVIQSATPHTENM